MRNEKDEFFASILDALKANFGNAAKAFWVYDDDFCPCCQKRKVGPMSYKGQEALSINAFMYRDRGVLIGYLLCGQCAKDILAQPNDSDSMHGSIETTLRDAYLRYINSLDA